MRLSTLQTGIENKIFQMFFKVFQKGFDALVSTFWLFLISWRSSLLTWVRDRDLEGRGTGYYRGGFRRGRGHGGASSLGEGGQVLCGVSQHLEGQVGPSTQHPLAGLVAQVCRGGDKTRTAAAIP